MDRSSAPTLIILIVVMVLLMWWMNRSAKKVQKRQEDERNDAIQLGAHVVTTAGFYGTIVSIDGDAVTLESPSGDETVWMRQAIRGVAEIPLAPVSEEEYLAESTPEDAENASIPATRPGSLTPSNPELNEPEASRNETAGETDRRSDDARPAGTEEK